MEADQYYCMRYYITYRCNSRCHYCNVWQEERFRNVKELELEDAEELISQCYQMGVRYIDFTGGEPTLNGNLVKLVRYAKSLGIKTEVTTNGIPHGVETMQEVAGCVDKFNISLDTLKTDTYRCVRGVDCLEKVLTAIREIVAVRRPKIMTAISKDNISEMADLIRFAQQNHMDIYLNPVFTYFDSDCGENADYTEQIKSKIYEPYTVVMLHFIEFIRNARSKFRPPCSANHRTLTFAPDGALMLPCYHGLQETIPWNGNLPAMLASERFATYAGGKNNGELCESCAVVPYFGISFNYNLNQYFLIQSYSEKLNHLKRDFLNQITELKESDGQIYNQLQELLDIIHSLYNNREHKYLWLYWVSPSSHGYDTDVYRNPLTEEEYQKERTAKDCWQLTMVPHYEFDKICENVYRKVFTAYQEGLCREEALDIFQDAAEFQLRLWKYHISKYMNVSVTCDFDTEISWLKKYMHKLQKWE